MTYKEYMATKPRFVYHGESETELKEKLENITGHKYMDTKIINTTRSNLLLELYMLGMMKIKGGSQTNWLFKDGISKSLII